MDKAERVKRLRSIEGHVRGVERMVEDGAYCIDVIRQIQAVEAALKKLSLGILNDHLHSCLITAVQGEDASERERVLREVAEVYAAAARA
jgi:DNA-binding FrmR family transcriptional regulator